MTLGGVKWNKNYQQSTFSLALMAVLRKIGSKKRTHFPLRGGNSCIPVFGVMRPEIEQVRGKVCLYPP